MTEEKKIDLVKLTKDVAFFLNEGLKTVAWEFKVLDTLDMANYPTQYIQNTQQKECEISIRAITYGAGKGRVEIGGNFHISKDKSFVDVREYLPSSATYTALPSITINAERGAQAIAKQIKSRFLPAYLPLLNKAIKKRDATEAHNNKCRANLLELAKIAKVLDRIEGLRIDVNKVSFYTETKGYGNIEAFDDSINLDLSNLSIEKAVRIIQIVME